MTEPDRPLDATRDVLLESITGSSERLAEILASADPTVEIGSCPGWDLRRLAIHVGTVHRWATEAARDARAPSQRPEDPAPGTPLGPWLLKGAEALVATLADLDPDAPTWSPFGGDHTARLWPRRMAHETVLHRVDAELATGLMAPNPSQALDAALASDTIDEYFEMMLPAALRRRGRSLPGSSLHVHCTDVAGEWLVWAEGSTLEMQREHAKGDAALRGPASALALAVWGRRWPGSDVWPLDVEVVGDQGAATAWLALGGA